MLRSGLICLIAAGLAMPQERPADIRVDVDLVPVTCSVTDHNIPVRNLQKSDFRLREDSNLQEIRYLWKESELHLTIGLIVDISASQAGLVQKHREAVLKFLRTVLRPGDQAIIVSVASRVWLNADLTSSIPELEHGIDRIGRAGNKVLGEPCTGTPSRMRRRRAFPCGGTVLWNSIYYASKLKMQHVNGRKAFLVLSDGLDTGSDHHLTDAIEAAQSAGTAVYTIKYSAGFITPVAALKHSLEALSTETGGLAFGLLHGKLEDVFGRIESDLREQYVLAYTSANPAHDGSYRKLEISIDGRPNLQIRARRGYRAPSN